LQLASDQYASGEQPEPLLRGPASIDGEYVVLDRGRASEWHPFVKADGIGRGDAIIELAASGSTPAQALKFVEGFGLLRKGSESADWRELLSVFQREASALLSGLSLYRDVRRASQDPGLLPRLREKWLHLGAPRAGLTFTEHAAVAVSALVTRGLVGVEERVLPVSNERELAFVSAARTPHLLGHIYHQFAIVMTGNVALRTCEDPACGRFFTPGDARQRHCSKAHADRMRQQRSRAARREGNQRRDDQSAT